MSTDSTQLQAPRWFLSFLPEESTPTRIVFPNCGAANLGHYGAALAIFTVHHWQDQAAGLREMARVCRPGGRLVLSVPAFPFLWGKQDVVSHHYRRYVKSEVLARLKDAGFEPGYTGYFNTWLFPVIAGIRLARRLTGAKSDPQESDFDVMPRPVVLLAAEWLQENAAMRWVLGDIGKAIFVRRGEGDSEALDAGLAVLRAGGVIGVGPEGGINRSGGLLPGRSGAAFLATSAGVPVLPIGLWGQEQLTRSWRRMQRPEISINIGAPLTFPAGEASAPELRRHTEEIMYAIAALLPPDYRGVYGEVRRKVA
jgi:hypothetical protein